MRYLLPLFFALTLALTALLGIFIFSNPYGWDARLYCQAAELDRLGGNPYLAQDFPGGLPWLYPPALLNFFGVLCASPLNFAAAYPLIYLLVIALSLPLWQPGRDLPTALILAIGALAGLAWALWSGNLEVILLLPVSLAFFSIQRSRWEIAAVCLGLMASIKILPLAYLPLLWLAPLPRLRKVRLLAIGLGTFLIIFYALTFSRPDLTPWYFRQLTGGLPGQGNPAAEFGGINHPAFPFFFAALFGWPQGLPALFFGMAIGGAVAIALFWLTWRFLAPHFESRERAVFLFSFAFLLLSLVLPRFKPYTFVLLLPALFLLLRRQNPGWQVLILPAMVVYPATAFYVYYHWLGTSSSALWANYSQTIALLISILLLMTAEWRRGRPLPAHA